MGRKLNILVACEESQAVCLEFRKLGHNAFSCDIQECSGGHPEWHIKDNVLNHLDGWDIIIAHPPCTDLAVSGARWFPEKIKDGRQQRAVDFFMEFVNAKCEKIAIENPIGIMSTRYRKPDQIIQPYYFGDKAEKRTCLWLKGLPLLIPDNIVEPPKRVEFKSGKSLPAWYAEAWNFNAAKRAKIRSKTFPGIAHAMAQQWGII